MVPNRKKPMKRLGLMGVGFVVAGLHLSGLAWAAETKTGEGKPVETKAGEKTSEKGTSLFSRAVPFQGNVVSVDPAAKTFTLNGKAKERVFKVNEQTEILIDNRQVQFNSIVVGAIVRGNALKHDDIWEAKKVTVGPKESVPASETKK